jgi:predicted phosphodiesterase
MNLSKISIVAITLLALFVNTPSSWAKKQKNVRFGICADVHKDIMFDADARLKTFIKEASTQKVDFIIQLGDFCRPYEQNNDFLAIWNNFTGERHHVVGNHDADGGFTRKQVIDFWKSPACYYSFDKNGCHFIVLDGNDKNPSPQRASGYARFIGQEQLEWLIKDLKSTQLPCVLFSHQTLENNPDGIENREQIRQLLENENKTSGFKKVIASFSGHHHTDYSTQINGIYYIQINSMSYEWLGEDYKTTRYSKEIDGKYPWIKFTIPYRDPLFAFVEISPNTIRIEGRKSTFVGPTPDQLKFPTPPENEQIIPEIRSRELKLK